MKKFYCVILHVWLILVPTSSVDPPEFPSGGQGQCSNENNQSGDGNAVLNTFIQNLVMDFGDQAEDGRHQFAVIVLVPPEVNDVFSMDYDYLPAFNDGYPVVDNTHPITPVEPQERINYVAARPAYNDTNDDFVHAEVQILDQLQTLLFNFRCYYGRNPAAIILYSWIIPCENCFLQIHQYLQNYPDIPRHLIYNTLGMQDVVDQNERDTIWLRNQYYLRVLREIGVFSTRVRCFIQHPHGSRQKRSTDEGTCEFPKTVQTCLYDKLLPLPQASCNTHSTAKSQVLVEVVNRLMAACAAEYFSQGCGLRYLLRSDVVSGACGTIKPQASDEFLRSVSRSLDECIADGQFIISKPMLHNAPNQFPGIATSTGQLSQSDQTIPCEDERREGLFCSRWKTEYLAAGNGVCKTKCGYHGKPYLWCDLEIGSWNVCCSSGCVNGWCHSGERRVWCFDHLFWVTKDGQACMPNTPCGYHNGNYYDPWCNVDSHGNTEYC